jgi:hypothetical protein
MWPVPQKPVPQKFGEDLQLSLFEMDRMAPTI